MEPYLPEEENREPLTPEAMEALEELFPEFGNFPESTPTSTDQSGQKPPKRNPRKSEDKGT